MTSPNIRAGAPIIFGVATMQGRPGDTPFTLVRAAFVHTTASGETTHEFVDEDTLYQALGAGQPVDDEYADDDTPSGFAFPGTEDEARALCQSAGFVENPVLPACVTPEQLFACVRGDSKGRAETVDLWAKEDTVWDDDLRDGVIAQMPEVIGDNAAEGCWEVAGRRTVAEVEAALVTAGYSLAPYPRD